MNEHVSGNGLSASTIRFSLKHAVSAASLNHYIEEPIPVGRLETAQAHGKSLDFADYACLNVTILLLQLLMLGQRHVEYALLNQVVVVK